LNDHPPNSPIDLPLRGPGGAPEPTRRRFDSGPDWSGERYVRKAPPPRGSRGLLWLLLLLLVAGGAAYFYFRPRPATPAFAPPGLESGEQRVGGAGDPQVVTVTNAGERPMRLDAVAVAGGHPEDFEVVREACTGAVQQPGESCTVEIRFTPREVGLRSAILDLTGNLAWRAPNLPLAGVGIAPRVTLDPESVDFGEQAVTQTSESSLVRFVNAGSDTLEVRGISLAGEHPADFVLEDRCSGRIFGPEERCAFRVSFRPRAAGLRVAEVRIESDAPGGAPRAALSGRGSWSGPAFTTEPAQLAFGDQRTGRESRPRPLELINRTAEARSAPGLLAPAAGSGFRISGGNCAGAMVAPGESCRVELAFAPEAGGSARGELTIELGGSSLHVDLSGRGVAPALSLEKSRLDFGDLRLGLEGAPLRLAMTNSGSSALALGGIGLTGKDAESFHIGRDGCSKASLAPAKSCSVELGFSPRREGSHAASLTVPSDAGAEAEAVELSGRGTRSFLSVRPSELAFGAVIRGESGEASLEISNRGTARLHVQGLRTEGPAADDYRITRIGCRLDEGLAPGESCSLDLQFRPAADGARLATLIVLHDGAEGQREVAMGGIGAPPLPSFSVTPGELRFAATVAGTRSAIQTVRVLNKGKGFLEIREVTLAGAEAEDFQIVAGTCEGAPRIAPGSECTVGVRFYPQSAGAKQAELSVRHNAPEGRGRVRLEGDGQ
jgi:hypothetical protein